MSTAMWGELDQLVYPSHAQTWRSHTCFCQFFRLFSLPGQKAFSFNVGIGQVVRGWDEGMSGMSEGEEARLEMTGDYAYAAAGFPAWGIGPNATLIFDIEILSIAK